MADRPDADVDRAMAAAIVTAIVAAVIALPWYVVAGGAVWAGMLWLVIVEPLFFDRGCGDA